MCSFYPARLYELGQARSALHDPLRDCLTKGHKARLLDMPARHPAYIRPPPPTLMATRFFCHDGLIPRARCPTVPEKAQHPHYRGP